MTRVTYTNWQTDMDRAPKGKMVTCSVTTKDGSRDFQSYEPDHVILMSECGKVIKSYWLPKEKRWAGFSATENPLAWQAWPEWCQETAAHALELRAGAQGFESGANAAANSPAPEVSEASPTRTDNTIGGGNHG